MALKRNTFMLMPPSIGLLNRRKTKYIKIYKGTEMKHVKMTNTLTALCARNVQQKDGLFEFSPKHIHKQRGCFDQTFGNSSRLGAFPVDSNELQQTSFQPFLRVHCTSCLFSRLDFQLLQWNPVFDHQDIVECIGHDCPIQELNSFNPLLKGYI